MPSHRGDAKLPVQSQQARSACVTRIRAARKSIAVPGPDGAEYRCTNSVFLYRPIPTTDSDGMMALWTADLYISSNSKTLQTMFSVTRSSMKNHGFAYTYDHGTPDSEARVCT